MRHLGLSFMTICEIHCRKHLQRIFYSVLHGHAFCAKTRLGTAAGIRLTSVPREGERCRKHSFRSQTYEWSFVAPMSYGFVLEHGAIRRHIST